MNLIHATVECGHCSRKFHQIDGTKERALLIVRAALAEHVAADHTDAEESGALTATPEASHE